MSWKERLENLKNIGTPTLAERIDEQKEIKGRKICISNGTPAHFFQDENGNISIKTGMSTGLTIDANNGVVTLSGNKLALIFKEIDMYSMPFQWRHNKFTINTLPVYAPGMGMILPDAPSNIVKSLQNIGKQFTKILKE